ncbi:MAG: flagellar biosynthesis protein FlhB, partial [Desulfobacterales bacterium]|nr:flagellar biosynthesis protein FlhB [Desulfobacterales bacterium]
MPSSEGQDRTEKATPKRRREARKKGQVASSREIPSVLILMTAMGFFYFAGSWVFWNLSEVVGGIYHRLDTYRIDTVTDLSVLAAAMFEKIFIILMPFFVPVLIAGLAGNIGQIGFEMHGQSMRPKLSKFNPISGLKKLVSLKSLVELAKSIIKIVIVGGIGYGVVKKEMTRFPPLMQQEVGDILVFIGSVAFKIFFLVCLVLIILAILDYIYQRWQHEENLKMTKQEVKDERKQSEGDPKVKSRIRKVQMEMAMRRMMEAVPDADVVITNPVHLAVALKFDAAQMVAPTVVAKGAGPVAERIKEIAGDHQVPIVEDKPLAQAL